MAMNWFSDLVDGVKLQNAGLWWFLGGSLALLVVTPIIVGWMIVHLPKDYFAMERKPLQRAARYPTLRMTLLVAKNLLGGILVIAGLLMLMLPGQGILTIVVGLVLLDFPGKVRLERWLVSRPSVWRSINWIRRRAHREPLEKPID
jgi:hypothetical protein